MNFGRQEPIEQGTVGRLEGVDDRDAGEGRAIVHVLAYQVCGAGLLRGDDDQRIPELQVMPQGESAGLGYQPGR